MIACEFTEDLFAQVRRELDCLIERIDSASRSFSLAERLHVKIPVSLS